MEVPVCVGGGGGDSIMKSPDVCVGGCNNMSMEQPFTNNVPMQNSCSRYTHVNPLEMDTESTVSQ